MTDVDIFVLGLDDLNLQTLQALPDADLHRFHRLLTADELIHPDQIRLPELLDKATGILEDFDGTVDAVIGYWDFPVSSMVPLLCRRFDLPGPRLEGVVKCEHKYWSRVEQAKVIDELPRFGIVDLAEDRPGVPDSLRFPMWLKPVNSASSELAFHVGDRDEFDEAVRQVRDGIDRFGKPFEFVLEHLDLPPEIAAVGGRACLAEEEVAGRQVTVEGFCHHGSAQVYGIVDSLTYPDTSSFLRYQYPADLPGAVSDRLRDASCRVMEQLGLHDGTFNIEYFWDPDRETFSLLEVNPRHSQSHARMFEYVDGTPNHQYMVQLALGDQPEAYRGRGPYDVAAKWYLRRFEDGVVRRIPSGDEVTELERRIDGVTVQIVPSEGDRLSELPGQDSYSFELAELHIGAADQDDLVDKYERCVDALQFEFDS